MAIGAIYAWLFYYFKPTLKGDKILALLRFLTVSTISYFLLSPLFSYLKKSTQKPIIVLLHDNSQSILNNKDSSFFKKEWQNQWLNLKNEFGSDYQVDYLTFGNQVKSSDSLNFSEKRTNLSHAILYLNNSYQQQNIGAVVLVSDGIFNQGSNPIYSELKQKTAIYSVGLGDTTIKKDILIKEAFTNSIAYLNNEFPLEISVLAKKCEGKQALLTVSDNGKTVFQKNINISQSNFYIKENITILADKPGNKHLVVTVSKIDGEYTTFNNRKDVFIDVIDGREKILIAYQNTHPDIGALKTAISSNVNFDVILKESTELNANDLKDLGVLILHGLPSLKNQTFDILKTISDNKIPTFFIYTSSTNINALNLFNSNCKIEKNANRNNQSQGIYNNNFNAFLLEENTINTISELPPMSSPYGQYNFANENLILCYQKVGSVQTKYPLWSLGTNDGQKLAYLFGEGLWQWRMHDFLINENHTATTELMNKTIQYLSTKEDKRKFKVYPVKNVYEEDDNVKFIAELYNNNYEPILNKDIQLTLTNSSNKQFQYTFSPDGSVYSLDIGTMPAGNYTFKTKNNVTNDVISGSILIKPLQLEQSELEANFSLLRILSQQNNGEFFYQNQLKELIKTIKNNKNITSTSVNEKKSEELIQIKWLFFLLLFFLSLEWFIRKYKGGI